jgi:hypothetical protein
MALARLRDETDRNLLEGRNRFIFGSSAVPSIVWLMDRKQGEAEEEQYKQVLDWVLRPDLYSYRVKEFGGVEFKRLAPTRKDRINLLKMKLDFSKTPDPECPLACRVSGMPLIIRVNDFPEQSLYTLVADGVDEVDFDDWPKGWRRPH